MSHILLTQVDRHGDNPELVLINTDSIVYTNSDKNDNPYCWVNVSAGNEIVSMRIKESPEEILEEIENLPIILD